MNSHSPNKTHSSNWVNGLDSLRFILALIVLLSHLTNPWAATLKNSPLILMKVLGSFLSVSFCGVGAVIGFFIISGFVIHYPNKTEITNVKKFLIRRWLRIGLPLLVISYIGIRINHFDFIPIWSLYCELIYYTIYPLLHKIKASWTTKCIYSFFLAVIPIVFFSYPDIQSFFSQKNINYSGAYWQLGTSLTWVVGLPCWLLGVVLADKLDTFKANVSLKQILLYRGSVFFIACVLTASKFHFYTSYILSMNFFAIILYHWIKVEILYYKNHKPWSILEHCGEFSYSMYLCHNFCFFFMALVLPLNNYTYIIYIFSTLAISYVYYIAIEKPSHALAKFAAKKIS